MKRAFLLLPVLLVASLACSDDDTSDSAVTDPPTAPTAAPSSEPTTTTNGAEPATGWTFVDDRGVEITLAEAPRRVVAYENAAGALIPLGVVPVGIFASSALADSPQLEGLDVSGIESVGAVYGELNFEMVAALEPDLIVTLFDPSQTGPAFGFLDNGEELAGAIAPVVAIDGGSTADAAPTIERFIELAESMGADTQSVGVDAQRQRFDDAISELESTVAEHPGVSVIAMAPYAGDLVYFARPDNFASLRLFREAGVELIEPEGEAGDQASDFVTFFYDAVSFEFAAKYPADLILLGNNAGAMDPAEVLADESFAGVAAVVQQRFVEWRMIDAYSYERFAEDIEALAEGIRAADPDLVP